VDVTLTHLPELELAGAAQDSVLRGLPLRRKELAAAAVSSACSAGGRRDREGAGGHRSRRSPAGLRPRLRARAAAGRWEG
jgi:hypothetical protein